MESIKINPGSEISEVLRPVLRKVEMKNAEAAAMGLPSTSGVFDMDALKSYVVPIVLTTTVSYFLQKTIDKWITGEAEVDQKKMFAELQEIVRASDLPTRDQIDETAYEHKIEPARRSMAEMRGLIETSIEKIDEAQKSLESAQDKTRCSLCKSTLMKLSEELKAGKKNVEAGTQYILTASDKWDAMQTLKSAGKIPREKSWEELTESERNMVRRIASHGK
jgi:hypothetical protein